MTCLALHHAECKQIGGTRTRVTVYSDACRPGVFSGASVARSSA
jgi:hypothetical protein